MFNLFLSYLAIYGISSNIMLGGAGTLELQREKQYASFRIISSLFLVLGIMLTSTISYFLYKYVYSTYNLYYINTSVNVLIVGIYNLFVSLIWRKFKKFNNYLYQNSLSYAFDVVFTLSVIFTLNMSLGISEFFISLLAIVIVVLITSLILGFFVRWLNRGYMNVSVRNVPARLFMLAILSIILYYASQLII